MKSLKTLLALLLALALVAAACGGDDDDAVATGEPDASASEPADEPMEEPADEPMEEDMEEAAEEPMEEEMEEPAEEPMEEEMEEEPMDDMDAAFPVTVAHGTGEITFETQPQRIVSLSPTATEMLFAVGAGDLVIAVDDQSNHPPEAPMTDLSGFTPNVEAIIGFEPDLVVSSGLPEDIEAGLAEAGIPSMSLFFGAVIEDTYTQIEQVGAATGHLGDAAELVAQIQADMAAIAADLPDLGEVTYYHELTGDLFSATSSTFIGQIYSMLGLVNVADEADVDGFGFPQLSAEYILEQDPDLIFLADTKCCGESAETVAARPGWDQLSAVQNGNVIELDDDIASRWGPRIVDFLQVIADATADLELADAG
ncbi:MAG: ABC transporter substrate-binding protein [Actinomycetota bacterium]